MKLLLSIALGLMMSATVCSQHFEGKIVYQNSYQSKLPSVSGEQFTELMGSRQEYFIKGGSYKSVSNGTYFAWQIYINKDNKLYNKLGHSETVLWYDGGKADDAVLEVAHNKDVIEILGYSCDELILKSKNRITTYYFSSKLGVDVSLYSKHLFGNWYEYLKIAKALPLKTVSNTDQITLTSVATEIKPMKLDDKEFTLPSNAKIEKNPN